MATLEKIGVLSMAKLNAILMGIFGLIMGIIYALALVLGGTLIKSVLIGASFGYLALITQV